MIDWKNTRKGQIETSQGIVEIHLKKVCKGASNFSLFIDGHNTGLKDLDLEALKSKAEEYTQGWENL